MAKQIGNLAFTGSMGNMTFYKSKYGMLVKMKSGVSKERIKNDAAFARTRRNNNEFGHACKAGKLFRTAFRGISKDVSDGSIVSRLMKEMLRAAKADSINERGNRNVIDGNLRLLTGFNFNERVSIRNVFHDGLEFSIDRIAGKLMIGIPSFKIEGLVKPANATHMKVISAGAAIDFSEERFDAKEYDSDLIALNNDTVNEIKITHQLTANSVHPLFLLLGVKYYSETNGKYEPIRGSQSNALSIVAVDTVPDKTPKL